MDSNTVRRAEDRFEHQQNEPSGEDRLEERREHGGHWGPEQGEQHQSKRGAAGAQYDHAMGRHEDSEFTDQPTVDPKETQGPVTITQAGVGDGPQVLSTSRGVQVLCGPLLNYRRMSGEQTENPIWHGSVLVVTNPGQNAPEMTLRSASSAATSNGPTTSDSGFSRHLRGEKLYEDPISAFWQFDVAVPFQAEESRWEYHIQNMQYVDSKKSHFAGPKTFAIPSKYSAMRIMFHSCNGFSVGTDTDAWSGCALWNDVLRLHERQAFHVMIGGGDQIYNDGVRVDGPLRPWTDLASPIKRRNFPFNEELRAQCDKYYFDNYIRWYGTEPFSTANCQIPQLNIWDDHDIIDGFGSYTDHFMRSSVFRGIGGVAHKYYLLFQHHIPPPQSTYTTDAPATMHANAQGTSGSDAVQLKDTFVMTQATEDPSYIIGKSPGPYVEERSRSIYCQLGASIAFIGIDARTERTRHQINYNETYDQIFSRANTELSANPSLKHLIVLLGVPIAYPRLQWLENIFQSPIIGPIRFLNRRFGIAGGFFNHFDGQVDLLDDLDDHYTAHQHKGERKQLILRLQALAKQHSVRVSILGGDVHLAALGRFFSNIKLGIPTEHDWRYMPNIISSAITNKPPPSAVANLLASRNKIHHLNADTDETLLNIFDQDPSHGRSNVNAKTKKSNHCTMPSRNYAIIAPSSTTRSHVNGAANGVAINGHATTKGHTATNGHTPETVLTTHEPPLNNNPRNPLHGGEHGAGTSHAAADGLTPTGLGGQDGLDVTFRVEINPSDREGKTQGYGFTIPGLSAQGYKEQGTRW